MKKFLSSVLLLVGSAVAGVLVWRKIEKDREDDLWAEAEKVSADMDAKREATHRAVPAQH